MSQPHQAREIGLGAVSILIGAALLVGSRGLGAIPGQNYGADTLPQLIAFLSIATGIGLLIQTLRPRSGPETPAGDGSRTQIGTQADTQTDTATVLGIEAIPEPDSDTTWIHDRRAWARLAAAFALVLAYALFSPLTGFIIAGFVVVAGFSLLMGVRPIHAVILGIVAAVALRYAFADILLVPLPRMDLSGFGG